MLAGSFINGWIVYILIGSELIAKSIEFKSGAAHWNDTFVGMHPTRRV